VTELRIRTRTTDVSGTSPAKRVEFNRTYLGPTRVAFERLDQAGKLRFAAELTDAH
jgi:hypothetical protein